MPVATLYMCRAFFLSSFNISVAIDVDGAKRILTGEIGNNSENG
jgi:hypothetical protein